MSEIPLPLTVRQKTLTELHQRAVKAALIAFGGLRIFTTLWMAALSLLVPVNGIQGLTWDPLPSQFVLGVQPLSRIFLLPWYRWDTLRYIQIA